MIHFKLFQIARSAMYLYILHHVMFFFIVRGIVTSLTTVRISNTKINLTEV